MESKGKNNLKLFCKSDILVYAFIIVAIALLFLFFIIIPARVENRKTTGILVEQNGKTVFTYTFSGYTFDVSKAFSDYVEITKTNNTHTVTVFSNENKTEYNVISIDNTNKTVKMSDTNCRSGQCTYMHALSNGGIIYCAPRALKISLVGNGGFTPAVTG